MRDAGRAGGGAASPHGKQGKTSAGPRACRCECPARGRCARPDEKEKCASLLDKIIRPRERSLWSQSGAIEQHWRRSDLRSRVARNRRRTPARLRELEEKMRDAGRGGGGRRQSPRKARQKDSRAVRWSSRVPRSRPSRSARRRKKSARVCSIKSFDRASGRCGRRAVGLRSFGNAAICAVA